MKKNITRECILPLAQYAQIRSEKKKKIVEIKRNRRLFLGPEGVFLFENFDTLLAQIHEMLYIEKGGEDQIEDEILAYAPLVPNGRELVSTFMLEIENPIKRPQRLRELGNIETMFTCSFAGHTVHAYPEGDMERTRDDGKTSAVHFLRWPMTEAQIRDFCQPNQDVLLSCNHPVYRHSTHISEAVRLSLAQDFDLFSTQSIHS